MKKNKLLAVCFFLCGSFLYAELTEAQLWAISLPGIMTEANSSYRSSLNASAMNESQRNVWLNVLSRDWGITTREELLETLNDLERGGHPDALKEIKGIINEVLNVQTDASAVQAVINSYLWDETKWNRFRYVFTNWDKYQNVTLWGWNLARGVSLCRWGYQAGFMEEGEAWKRIFHIAETVQPLYASWEEFGWDYFMGRLFWAASFGEGERYLRETEPIYNRLMNSYWGRLKWDIDLEAEEEDVPLIPRSFSPPDDNDGMLRYLTNDPGSYNRYYWEVVSNHNNDVDPNVYEMRVKKLSGEYSAGFGMIFCADDRETARPAYYNILISMNGQFAVQKRIGTSLAATHISWRASSFLETEYGVYNTLRVERENLTNGAYFRIYINGNLAATFIDTDPLNGVNFGPIVNVGFQHREQFPHIHVDVRFEY